jgi:actin beta/gamma 1
MSWVVVEIGSQQTKATLSAGLDDVDTSPCTFTTVLGRPRMPGFGVDSTHFGADAFGKRGILNLNYPIQDGHLVNENDFSLFWGYLLKKLRLPGPKGSNVVLVVAADTTQKEKERLCEIIFETYGHSRLAIFSNEVCAAVASGREDALVLNVGYDSCRVVPVYQSHPLFYAIEKIPIGVNQVLDVFMQLLAEKGNSYVFYPSQKLGVVSDIFAQLGYISLDFERDMQISNSLAKSFDYFPADITLTLDKERFQATELWFQPNLCFGGWEKKVEEGLPKVIAHSLSKCVDRQSDQVLPTSTDNYFGLLPPELHEQIYQYLPKFDLRSTLLNNVILTGSPSLLPGWSERLHKELSQCFPSHTTTINIIAPPQRDYSGWLGGTILGRNPQIWNATSVTSQQFVERGSSLTVSSFLM